MFAAFGAYGIRGVITPFYPTSSGAQVSYMMNDAEVRLLFVGEQQQYDIAMSVATLLGSLERIVIFDRSVKRRPGDTISEYFDDFIEQGRLNAGTADPEIKKRKEEARFEDIADILYTSGTTGNSKGVIMTYTDANGNRTSYTAEDLLKNYQSYSSSLSSEFDKIYEVLVRHYYDQDAQSTKLASLKAEATNKVLSDKQKAEKNAANNKTSYEAEFQTYLDAAGADNVDELYQKYLYDEEKADFQNEIYNTYGTGDDSVNGYVAMKDGYYNAGGELKQAFPESKDATGYVWGRGSEGWLGTQMPYHIRHILIKLAGGGDKKYAQDRIAETANEGGETTKLTSTLFRLAGATIGADGKLTTDTDRWTFGSIAKSFSDDEGSAKNFGEYGIMEKTMAQDLVHEFKLGTYAFESLYSAREKASSEAYKLMPGLEEEATSAADIDNKQTLLDSNTTVHDYFANFDDDNDGIADGVGQIPFGAAIALYDTKKVVTDAAGNPVWNDNQDSFYPRNVIYNKYFNKHNVCVITPNVIGSNYKSALLDDTSKTAAASILAGYQLSADGKSVTAEDFKGSYSTQLGALPGFSVDTTNVLTGADFQHNVLTNEKGQVILAVRAGAGSSYQGIHFMTVERSALNKYGLKLDGNKYVEATAADLGTVTALGTVNGKAVEKIAYTVASPDAWQQRGLPGAEGDCIADVFARNGVPLLPADNRRVHGWQRLREALALQADGQPGLVIFPQCTELLRTLPLLTYDEHDHEDVSDGCEDHAPEALRYAVMSRHPKAVEPERKAPPAYDPFAPPRLQNEGFTSL